MLSRDIDKRIILDSLEFLVSTQRSKVTAFTPIAIGWTLTFILIWQVLGDHKREEVQRDFCDLHHNRFSNNLRNEKSELLPKLEVNAKDRKYQIWQRNSLGI